MATSQVATQRRQITAPAVSSLLPQGAQAGLSDPLSGSELQDPLESYTSAQVGRRTRLHTADDKGEVNAARPTWRSSGGTTGGSISSGSRVDVDFDTLDPTLKWAKARRGDTKGWIHLDKVRGEDAVADYKVGDKFYGLGASGDGKRAGYAGQVLSTDARFDVEDRPSNFKFVNALAGQGLSGVKGDTGRNREMADSLARNGKWKDKLSKGQEVNAKHASQASLQATVDTMKKGNKVRFLLDDIDSKDVVPGGKYAEACTSHELRYAYRNWSQFKGKMAFFRGGKQVPPPWVTEPEVWKKVDEAGPVHYDV